MDVREKLVELIFDIAPYGTSEMFAGHLADHLIAHGVTVQELDGCEYCKVPVYVKTIKYAAPVLAPMTRVEEIRQQLYNLTGEVYLELPKRFCPMCGKELPQPPEGE